jgi:hypothetical protein
MLSQQSFADLYVDESIRAQSYYLCGVVINHKDSFAIRSAVRSLRVSGQRIHFNKESDANRERILEEILALQFEVVIVRSVTRHGVSLEKAREISIEKLVEFSISNSVGKIVLETRGDDTNDRRVIHKARAGSRFIEFNHISPTSEPLLWIPDAIAWAFGSGGKWRRIVDPVVRNYINKVD